MTCFLSHTSIDCRNAYELSSWWCDLLGYRVIRDDANGPGEEECMIERPDGGHQLLFLEVPDEKSVKNRIHLDLRPAEGTQDEEVARVLAQGATQIADFREKYGPGTGWVVLADPEGNEFCILRSEAEVAARS